MQLNRPVITLAIALTVAGGYLAGIQPGYAQEGGSDSEYLDALYQAAKEAGQTQVTVYAPSSAVDKPVYDAFAARFPGITVTGVDLGGPPLMARLEADYASGNPTADIVSTGEADSLIMADKNWLQQFVPETAKGLPEQYIGRDGLWINWAVLLGGPVINTAHVTADERPDTWADLVDPRWKGRIAMDNPVNVNGLSQRLLGAFVGGIVDWSWGEALAALDPAPQPTAAATLNAITVGQKHLAPVVAYQQFVNSKQRGAPVEFIFPKEGIVGIGNPLSLMEGAPHPEAAKLLIAWLVSEEGQKVGVIETGRMGTMPSAPAVPGVPEGTPVTVTTWVQLEKEFPAWLAKSREVFGN